jgi:hypothetical protein
VSEPKTVGVYPHSDAYTSAVTHLTERIFRVLISVTESKTFEETRWGSGYRQLSLHAGTSVELCLLARRVYVIGRGGSLSVGSFLFVLPGRVFLN